ncbi:TPA: hypothetical protein I7294_22825 [Vibrio parahaemolyticus]|nr:hypothetical protein [Vibrio parahaemolyticus]
MNLASRKICKGSCVASLVFIVGWWLISLAQNVERTS